MGWDVDRCYQACSLTCAYNIGYTVRRIAPPWVGETSRSIDNFKSRTKEHLAETRREGENEDLVAVQHPKFPVKSPKSVPPSVRPPKMFMTSSTKAAECPSCGAEGIVVLIETALL